MPDRTAPFQEIRTAPLGPTTQCEGRMITRTVNIPGLVGRGGAPVTVDVTHTLDEIDYQWVSAIVDHAYDTAPVVYGAHPHAVGPLRELLPEAYPLPAYPSTRRVARNEILRMLGKYDLGGWVFSDLEYSKRNLRVELPTRIQRGDTSEEQYFFAMVREYVPFDAHVWWDVDNRVVRIRPTAPQEEIAAHD